MGDAVVKRRGPGQPSKYKPEYKKVAVEFLGQGHSITGLAGHLGVDKITVQHWMARYEDFSLAVRAGQAAAVRFFEDRLLDVIHNDGSSQKVSAITFGLRNRDRAEWGDKQQLEHTGTGSLLKIQISRDPKDLSDDELDDLISSGQRARAILAPPPDKPDGELEE